jgi:zinc protease
MRRSSAVVLLAILVVLVPVLSFGQLAQSVDIPYKKFVLDNGLTVIIHEDHKAPIAAFNVWYHVGSKNEKPGKTGFAHLFEHLMFNGSENYKGEYFAALEKVGATDLNGTTSEDRTNYFENVPAPALDVALWMESDRMGHLLGAVTQPVLDEQRGVVQNEKRQFENEPYALAYDLIQQACFPKGHPYSWTVLGSMGDLSAASLADVHEWFKTYYGAANAVVVVAGDVKTDEALAKVNAFFGDVPPGPPITKHESWIAKRSGLQRQIAQDRVPQARVSLTWNVSEWGSPDAARLDLAADVLASGKTSRLFKRLVYDDQIATDVSADNDSKEIAGLFTIQASAKPGVEPAVVEKAVREELDRFLKDGPTADELQRHKTRTVANFIRGLERIGGFGGKSDILATSQVLGGSPEAYKARLATIEKATVEDVLGAAKRWLSDGVYVLEILPYPQLSAAPSTVDRTKLPAPGAPPAVRFPALERAALSNGLKVILARRDAVPVLNIQLLVDAGTAADQFASPGTASLAMNMLDEGTKTRSSLQISEELQRLGAGLGTNAGLDTSSVTLSALKPNLDASLEIFADVILNPSFPENEFARLQKQTLAAIQQEKAEPFSIALRVFPALLYGASHAYGNPMTGSGTEASVAALTVKDLRKYHETWFKSSNATLVVVGAASLDEIKPRLEKLFAGWKKGEVPKKNIGAVAAKTKHEVYLIDKPGSPSSILLAGHLTLPKANPEEIAVEAMNNILGGTFTSRINMNLREDKHWSYGAGSVVVNARGQRPLLAYGIVQTDKTRESVLETAKEFKEIVSTRPPSAEEIERIKANMALSLPGQWETNGAVLGSIAEMVSFGLPGDYYDTYAGAVRSLTPERVGKAAKDALRPDGIIWVIVGDRAKVEAGLKELGFGEVRLIDADGRSVK